MLTLTASDEMIRHSASGLNVLHNTFLRLKHHSDVAFRTLSLKIYSFRS